MWDGDESVHTGGYGNFYRTQFIYAGLLCFII